MNAAQWIFPILIVVVGAYWLIDFIVTGEPKLTIAVVVLALGVFTALILPRLGRTAQPTSDDKKEDSSDA